MNIVQLILDKKSEYITKQYLNNGGPKKIILSFDYYTELCKAVDNSGQPLIYDITWHSKFSRCHGKIFGMQISLTKRKGNYIRILPEKMKYRCYRHNAAF
jgi:hypothetical protein